MQHVGYKKSIGWVVSWSLCFSVVMTLAKKIGSDVPGATLVFFRLAIGLIFAMPIFMAQGLGRVMKTQTIGLHFIRAAVVSCSMGCTYYTYRNLPLADAAAIGQTGPLFTTLLAVLLLRESMTLLKWLAMLVGYMGVLFIVKPGVVEYNSAIFVALAGNLLAGLAIVMAKTLSKDNSSQTILFYGTVGTLVLASIHAFFYWQTPSTKDCIFLVLIGISGMASQYCYLQALKYAPASFVTPFEYTRLCVTIPIGMVVFHETPDVYSIVGSLIILASIIFIVRQPEASEV